MRAISQQLSALAGVRDVHILLDRAEVTVLSDHPLTSGTIASVIARAGYAINPRGGP
jgi:copper chaperone CopZ